MQDSISFSERFTPAEAAIVSQVSLRDVHRVIDEHILPEGFSNAAAGRTFTQRACVFISFYFRSAGRLTAEERQRAIELATEISGERDWIIRDGFLAIDLASFRNDVEAGLARLRAARAAVVSDHEILGGAPVLRGTRVPVYDVAASVTAGIAMERILSAYPSLRREQVELACLYAEANPQRGRPRLRTSLPPDAKVLIRRSKQRIATKA